MMVRSLVLLIVLAACPTAMAQQQNDTAATTTTDAAAATNGNYQEPPLVGMEFGLLDLQIRSRSTSTLNHFLFNILSETSGFLDDHLGQSSSSFFHKGVVFDHVTLGVDSYDLVESPTISVNTSALTEDKVLSYASNYDASVTLQGMLLFSASATAKEPYHYEIAQGVKTVLTNHAADLQERLQSTHNTLLNDMRFMIVSLNGETLAGGQNAAAFRGSKPRGGSNTTAATTTTTAIILPTWAMAVMTGLGSCLLVLALLFVSRHVCRSCRLRRGRHRRQFGVPKQKLTTDTADYHDNDDDDEDIAAAEASPMNSDIVSVASSAFTYNPAHLYGNNGSSRNSHSGAAATASNNNHSLLLFHNDISAITNKKDLSLIDEEVMSESDTTASVDPHNNTTTPQGNLLSRRQQRYDHDDSMSPSSSSSKSNFIAPLDLEGPAHTVIDDLNDLSAQIDTYRRSSTTTNRMGQQQGDFV